MLKNLLRLAIAGSLLFGSVAKSQDVGFDAILFDPAVDNSDYFTVRSSKNLKARGVHVGLTLDYARRPLELGAPLGERNQGVSDNMLVVNLYGSFALTDWVQIGVNLPVVSWNDFTDINTSIQDARFSLGDIYVEAKFQILDSEQRRLGLAIIPFINLPTGSAFEFTGSGEISGGAKLAADFKFHERVRLALNVGYRFKNDVTIRGARIDDQLLLALGLNVKATERLFVIAEAYSEHAVHDLFDDQVHNPIEARLGVKFKATERIAVHGGVGAGFNYGVGAPDFRAFLGATYTWEPSADQVIEAKKIMINQKIYFEFDKSVIKPNSYAILNEVADVIKSNNLRSITIEGHTDYIGSDAYNLALSRRRANSVREYLIQRGVPASSLTAVGKGESEPIASNETDRGRASNRRTEFIVAE